MENEEKKVKWWKKVFYFFLLLVFFTIGAGVWLWDISLILSIIISIISITMINVSWEKLKGKNE